MSVRSLRWQWIRPTIGAMIRAAFCVDYGHFS